MKLKVGVVGCGNIAKVHLRYIVKYVPKENIALCDRDGLRLAEFSKESGIKTAFADLNAMLNEFRPDIVHILTPPASHTNIALQCLENECHIMVEKPLSVTVDEADKIIEKADAKKRLVCVDLTRLFDPQIIKAREILSSGVLGDIVNISAGYSYDFFKRSSVDPASRWINSLPGGSLFDIMPHPLCLLQDFLPDLLLEKSAYRKNENNVITDLWCIFSSSRGTGSLHMSLNIFPLKNYIIFECTGGILTVDLRNILTTIRKKYNLPNAVERIVGNLSVGLQIIKGTADCIYNFLRGKLDTYAGLDYITREFYNAVIDGGESPIPPQKAKSLISIADEVFSSEKKGIAQHKISEREKLNDVGILVTGGTGFIGRRLVNNLLAKGFSVRILTHRNSGDKELGSYFNSAVQVIHGDIYNYEDAEYACRGVNAVYHLAAAMGGDWKYHLDTTITGTKNILTAAGKTGVKRFIYVSTVNVYNAKWYPNNGIINEDFDYEDMPERRGAYSHAKLRAENIVRQCKNSNHMMVSIVRPGLVYGPGREIFLRDVGYRLGKKIVVVLGSGRRRLPLVYVDNLADALLFMINQKEGDEGIYNVVDPEYPTQREFISAYKDLTKERFFTVNIPMWVLFAGFWFLENLIYAVFRKRIFFRYKLRCISRNVKHSTERIEKKLGWRPEVGFKEGLKLNVSS